jgi:hypothetical protein
MSGWDEPSNEGGQNWGSDNNDGGHSGGWGASEDQALDNGSGGDWGADQNDNWGAGQNDNWVADSQDEVQNGHGGSHPGKQRSQEVGLIYNIPAELHTQEYINTILGSSSDVNCRFLDDGKRVAVLLNEDDAVRFMTGANRAEVRWLNVGDNEYKVELWRRDRDRVMMAIDSTCSPASNNDKYETGGKESAQSIPMGYSPGEIATAPPDRAAISNNLGPGPCQIRINGLPPNTNKQDLKNLFPTAKGFPEPKCAIGSDKTVGYAKFPSSTDTIKASKSLSGTIRIRGKVVNWRLETVSENVREKGGSTVG